MPSKTSHWSDSGTSMCTSWGWFVPRYIMLVEHFTHISEHRWVYICWQDGFTTQPLLRFDGNESSCNVTMIIWSRTWIVTKAAFGWIETLPIQASLYKRQVQASIKKKKKKTSLYILLTIWSLPCFIHTPKETGSSEEMWRLFVIFFRTVLYNNTYSDWSRTI